MSCLQASCLSYHSHVSHCYCNMVNIGQQIHKPVYLEEFKIVHSDFALNLIVFFTNWAHSCQYMNFALFLWWFWIHLWSPMPIIQWIWFSRLIIYLNKWQYYGFGIKSNLITISNPNKSQIGHHFGFTKSQLGPMLWLATEPQLPATAANQNWCSQSIRSLPYFYWIIVANFL